MRFELQPHPSTDPGAAPRRVSVSVHRGSPAVLTLTCDVVGDMGGIILPERAAPGRSDGLWRRTCFEMFVRAAGDAYYEFNFSPSLQWAAYRFGGYRSGMSEASPKAITGLGHRVEAGGFGGHASVDLGELDGVDLERPLRIGLSAVIQGPEGCSFWALAHPAGPPDFHVEASFAADVPTVVHW